MKTFQNNNRDKNTQKPSVKNAKTIKKRSFREYICIWFMLITIAFTIPITLLSTKWSALTNKVDVINASPFERYIRITCLNETVEFDYISEKVKSIEHIERVYSSVALKNEISIKANTFTKKSSPINVYTYNESYKDYLQTAIDEIKDNEIIIPKYFDPDLKQDYNNKKYLDGEQYVGKEIEFSINVAPVETDKYYVDTDREEYEIGVKYKVVGTYDNIKANSSGNNILVNENTQKEITKKSMEIDDAEYSEYWNSLGEVYVRIDDGSNKSYVIDKITELFPSQYYALDASLISEHKIQADEDISDTLTIMLMIAIVMFMFIAGYAIGKRNKLIAAIHIISSLGIAIIISLAIAWLFIMKTNSKLEADLFSFEMNEVYSINKYILLGGVIYIVVGAIAIAIICKLEGKYSKEKE